MEAAKRAGLTEAEIFVGNFDDQTMVRIYARENATQRSKQSTAIDGSVLAAVRLLARQLLTTSYEFIRGSVFESERSFTTAKGTLEKGDGIGKDLVHRVLNDMPGIGINAIIDSLGRLKASGDYARTLLAVQQQIEAEAEAARRFRRYPWEVRQRQKLYKNCTFGPNSCTTNGAKYLYKVACLKPSGRKAAFLLETCRNRDFYILLGPPGRLAIDPISDQVGKAPSVAMARANFTVVSSK